MIWSLIVAWTLYQPATFCLLVSLNLFLEGLWWNIFSDQKYTHAVLRVSAVRNLSYDMYMKMGFEDIGVYTEVHSRRVDGRVSTDRRLFLSKLLTRRAKAEDKPDGEPEGFGTSS